MYMKKYTLRIALLHGFLTRNDNEQMIAIGQKIKYNSNQFQINFKNKVK